MFHLLPRDLHLSERGRRRRLARVAGAPDLVGPRVGLGGGIAPPSARVETSSFGCRASGCARRRRTRAGSSRRSSPPRFRRGVTCGRRTAPAGSLFPRSAPPPDGGLNRRMLPRWQKIPSVRSSSSVRLVFDARKLAGCVWRNHLEEHPAFDLVFVRLRGFTVRAGGLFWVRRWNFIRASQNAYESIGDLIQSELGLSRVEADWALRRSGHIAPTRRSTPFDKVVFRDS